MSEERNAKFTPSDAKLKKYLAFLSETLAFLCVSNLLLRLIFRCLTIGTGLNKSANFSSYWIRAEPVI